MAYRIVSLERIDAASLQEPLPPGHARFKAVVEMWDGDAIGPPHVVEDFIVQRPTQFMRPVGGDDWALVEKSGALVHWVTQLIEQHEDAYAERIRNGVRGFLGDVREDQHGAVKPLDPIAHHATVRKLIREVRGKRGR